MGPSSGAVRIEKMCQKYTLCIKNYNILVIFILNVEPDGCYRMIHTLIFSVY